MFRERFTLIHQRLLLNPHFTAPILPTGEAHGHEYYQLTPIESLIGSQGRKCVLGILYFSIFPLYQLFLSLFSSLLSYIFSLVIIYVFLSYCFFSVHFSHLFLIHEGMITQLKEGQYYLEDLRSNVRLDLSNISLPLTRGGIEGRGGQRGEIVRGGERRGRKKK